VWSYDFVFDWCANGQQLKCLTVTRRVDEGGPGDGGGRAHSIRARRVRKHAKLTDTVSFASFRKGGMTEMGESGLTDQQIISLSGHKTRQMVSVYSRATAPLRIGAAAQRLAYRQDRKTGTDRGPLSE
jgi:hypothetical protein